MRAECSREETDHWCVHWQYFVILLFRAPTSERHGRHDGLSPWPGPYPMRQLRRQLSGSKLLLRNLGFTPPEAVLSSGDQAADVLMVLEDDDQRNAGSKKERKPISVLHEIS